MTEFTGYIATFLVMLSFMMKNVTRLRVINAIGCATWILYGFMLDSNPIIVTNVGILAINTVHLLRNFLNSQKYNKYEQNNKFYTPPTFRERIEDLKYTILFWKGRKKRFITTRNLEWIDLRYIFFPSKLEKYGYMGITFYKEDSVFTKTLMPLVLAMDYEAKPYWCPRWFLRFLHVFGNDKSIVRVRNHRLSNLHRKLTKGIQFWDWKTKWSDYDLRISISAPEHLQDLAGWIEQGYYNEGYRAKLMRDIAMYEPDPDAKIIFSDIKHLEEQLEELESKNEQD